MNLSEALGWMKTLQHRHAELLQLRNSNSARTTQRYGTGDAITTTPEYNVKKLDKRATLLAREIRLLDEAIKRSNAATQLAGFERRDEVLGELED